MILNFKKIEVYALGLAVFLYAFSTPFPKDVGLIEGIIGLLLMLFLGSSFKYLFAKKNTVNSTMFMFFY